MRTPIRQILGSVNFLAVYLPLFALIATMKLHRGITLGSVDSVLSALLYLTSEFVLFALLATLSYLFLHYTRRIFLRRSVLFLSLVLTISVVLVEVVTHALFVQTGLILNWSMLLFGLERSEALFKLTVQQVTILTMVFSVILILYLTLVPFWLIRRSHTQRAIKQHSSGPGLAVVFLFAYAVLLVFSSAAGLPREEFRGATGHLLLSYFELEAEDDNQYLTPVTGQPSELVLPDGESINNRINVAIVILESTREKSVAPYVETQVTPYFRELAGKSLLLKQAYSTSPHTSRAIYSILCGKFPRAGKHIAETLENGITHPCLPHVLEQQGYATVFFQSATEDFENRAQLTDNMGFSSFFPLEKLDTSGYEKSNYFGYEDNIMLPASDKWLKQQEQAFLATYLTVTPHFHYDLIKRYGWKNYTEDKKYNAYLNTLHYQDNFLKNLIQQYKDLGLYENTLFVILGDHGEGFREHRLWGHGNILYEEGVKVPFILHHGDKLNGAVDTRVSLLDVVPSILGHLEFNQTDNFYQGQDLRLVVEQRDILLECINPRQCTSLIDANRGMKLIHNYERRPDELFDLTVDTEETNNLANEPKYMAIKQEMLGKLQRKITEITMAESAENYDGWAYNWRPVSWLENLPVGTMSFQNKFTNRNVQSKETSGILQVSASKSHVYASDSFALSLVFSAKNKNICIDSFYTGIKRHTQRTRNVATNAERQYAYFQITENLQVLPTATMIEIDVYEKTDCSDNAALLSQSKLVIDLLEKEDGDVVFSDKGNQLFKRQMLPVEPGDLQSSKYLNELLDSGISPNRFSGTVRQELKNTAFVDKFRNSLIELQGVYGRYQSNQLESAWKATAGESIYIYRYRLFFSKNRSMDFRVHVQNSEIIALYYYHPWRDDRPL